MKRRTFIQSFAAGAVTLIGIKPQINFGAEAAGSLETAFREPPAGAHCKTWWHWMNGNITAEGITMDLEAMKRVGIRGFQIFQVGTGIPKARWITAAPNTRGCSTTRPRRRRGWGWSSTS